MRITRRNLLGAVAILATLGFASGCRDELPIASSDYKPEGNFMPFSNRRIYEGTSFRVQLGQSISTETAQEGDVWHGTLAENVTYGSSSMVPAGSRVSGIVSNVVPAKRGSRAVLNLQVRSVDIHGQNQHMLATMPEIVAGSTRARNLGAVAGGALAGALIGRSVGDHDHTAAGALIGGAATAGAIATQTKGYQVALKSGTVLDFTVSETVSMR